MANDIFIFLNASKFYFADVSLLLFIELLSRSVNNGREATVIRTLCLRVIE